MTEHTIAVVGLSGVGKTAALNSLAERYKFQHLGASRLIREGRERGTAPVDVDALRHADLDENQRLLIAGFDDAKDNDERYVVLDGHTVIETSTKLVPISSDVFRELGITRLVFLAATPVEITQRRKGDISRMRPTASTEEIGRYQETALLQAFRISVDLQIQLNVITSSRITELARVMFDCSAPSDP